MGQRLSVKMKRNASIELLRCVLMFLIVFHHSAFWGHWQGDCSQHLLIFVGSVAIMWHVDAFVAISGWFGIKFSWKKFFALWSQVAFYSVLSLIFLGEKNHWRIGISDCFVRGGWFVPAYFLLMLISPLLNAGIDNLFQKGEQTVRAVWKILAIGIILSASPLCLISCVGNGLGEAYSVSVLVFIYVTANCFRRLDIRVGPRVLVMTSGVYLGFMLVLYAGLIGLVAPGAGRYHRLPWITAYNQPWVWAVGIILVAFVAQNIKISGFLARASSFCAPSMFGIYLAHNTTSFGHLIFQVPERYLAANTNLPSLVIVALCATGCFAVCLVIDLMRRALFGVVGKMILKFKV